MSVQRSTIVQRINKHRRKEITKLKKYRKVAIHLIDSDSSVEAKKLGWIKENTNHGQLYINKKDGVIVKTNYLTSGPRPRVAVPTVTVKSIKLQEMLLIQPLLKIDPKSTRHAEEVLDKSRYKNMRDLKQNNVGLYKGIPVMHDW